MSIANNLLHQILHAAKSRGMDQAELARAAGIAPETVSRAKKRDSFDISTLSCLAKAAGYCLGLEATHSDEGSSPQPYHLHPLAHPSRGLTWSNPNASPKALTKNALAKRSFDLILQASLEYGIDYVKEQWADMLADQSLGITKSAADDIDRQIRNIKTGADNAST